METNKRENIYLDYNSISLKLDSLAPKIKEQSYDGIVILLRGGSYPGMHLAFLTGLPYYFLTYDRQTEEIGWNGVISSNEKLLLVEDFAGSGTTLLRSKQFLVNRGFDVDTCVICKDTLSASEPDYYCFYNGRKDARFVLPWERHIMNPSIHKVERGSQIDLDFERTAWDMDGIFLKDIDSIEYVINTENALNLRYRQGVADFAPTPKEGDMIITGRVITDKERTTKWLERNQINIPVLLRHTDIDNHSHEVNARWKGEKAVEHGFTHYVESDPEQAILIASDFPELRVIWWNKGNPINVQGAIQNNKRLITV